jgi:hypothetical protein
MSGRIYIRKKLCENKAPYCGENQLANSQPHDWRGGKSASADKAYLDKGYQICHEYSQSLRPDKTADFEIAQSEAAEAVGADYVDQYIDNNHQNVSVVPEWVEHFAVVLRIPDVRECVAEAGDDDKRCQKGKKSFKLILVVHQ